MILSRAQTATLKADLLLPKQKHRLDWTLISHAHTHSHDTTIPAVLAVEEASAAWRQALSRGHARGHAREHREQVAEASPENSSRLRQEALNP